MAENNSAINSVAVIGAGTMGRGIAYLLALNGIRTGTNTSASSYSMSTTFTCSR
ncbi:3-hydroxyacyl-CoA dehydrogenase NAD-binding domain-containing protein [Serratia quinivorans]|uniref:3-hydroxyacyl-CoA dehydrogenase NAD-binding domain-containing protein n=1 Tax=Serratia quinivorans TaxID=137545 RepID=UPI003F95F59D